MNYFEQSDTVEDADYTVTKSNTTDNKPKEYGNGDNPVIPPQVIHSFTWSDYKFITKLYANEDYGKKDPKLGAAEQYLKDQFQYTQAEADAALSIYKKNPNRSFWQTEFSPCKKGSTVKINETCGGYIWRLFRKNEQLYKAKRDFLVLILIEYTKDPNRYKSNKDRSLTEAQQLNLFLRLINDTPLELTPENLQKTFFEAEEEYKQLWLKTAQKKQKEKLLSNYPKQLKTENYNQPKIDNELGSYNTLEKDAENSEKIAEYQMLNHPYNYEKSSELASSKILGDFWSKHKGNPNIQEYQKRFSRYLNNILLNQVKYNYLLSQKKPLSFKDFSKHKPQLDNHLDQSDEGKKANQLLNYYRLINKKHGIPLLDLGEDDSVDNDPSTVERSSTSYDKRHFHNGELSKKNIQSKIQQVRKMQWMSPVKDYRGETIWLDGEIPSTLYLSDQIIQQIILAKPEEINYSFLQKLINQELIFPLWGFRNTYKNYKYGDPNAIDEFLQIKEYVKGKDQLDKALKVHEKFLNTKNIIPIQAALLPNEVSKSILKTVPIELRLYLKKRKENEWQIIDLTNPTNRSPHQPTASGNSDFDAIRNVMEKFSKNDNSYIPGKLVFSIPDQFSKTQKMLTFDYTGKNWKDEWAKWMSSAGNFLDGVGKLLRIVPHPLARLASSAFIAVGQITETASAALTITKKIEQGNFNWDLNTISEGLTLVSGGTNLLKSTTKGKTKLFFNSLDKTGEIGGYIMIPLQLQNEIDKIKNDPNKTYSEKQLAVHELVKKTAWSVGSKIVFDKLTTGVSQINKNRELNDRINLAGSQNTKKSRKKDINSLPNIEVQYQSLEAGKVAKVNQGLRIVLNKDIVINRKKRFNRAIKEEKAHIWIKILHGLEPDIYNAATTKIRETDEFQNFKDSDIGLQYSSFAKNNGYNNEQINNFLAEEFLAKVISKEYKTLTFHSTQGVSAYKKLIKAIDRLLKAIGLKEGSITEKQLRTIINDGQRQVKGETNTITKAKAERIIAFFEGKGTLDVTILGKKYKDAKRNKHASKEILFRQMYQLDDKKSVVAATELDISQIMTPRLYSFWKSKNPSYLAELEEFYKNKKFAGDVLIDPKSGKATLDNYKKLVEKADYDENVTQHFIQNSLNVNYNEQSIKTIISTAKEHLFMKEHVIPDFEKGKGNFVKGRFAFEEYKIKMWNDMYVGSTLTPQEIESFKALIIHEYIEAKLMEKNIPFRKFEEKPGAHDFSINESKLNFNHLRSFNDKIEEKELPVINPDLSNIDKVVNQLYKLYNK